MSNLLFNLSIKNIQDRDHYIWKESEQSYNEEYYLPHPTKSLIHLYH